MRAVRVAFPLLLLLLPADHVLAQVDPDGLVAPEVPELVQDAPAIELEASVPAAVDALLWHPVVEDRGAAFEPPSGAAPLPRAWSDWSTEKKVLVVGGAVVALIILGIVSIG